MKITVSINLGGYSFNIDEDAYAELKGILRILNFILPEKKVHLRSFQISRPVWRNFSAQNLQTINR